jgi:hypothetical protein
MNICDLPKNFLPFGYYIVVPSPTPEYMRVECEQILTATECICNLHPNMQGSFWLPVNQNCSEQHKEYQKLLGFSNKEFTEFKDFILQLYVSHKIDGDGRFAALSDTVEFSDKWLGNISNAKIVSLHLGEDCKDMFMENFPKSNIPIFSDASEENCEFLGYDIMGWDMSGFHSFHCNDLAKIISEKYNLKLNNFGLIQNSYSEVKEFAEYIDDKGEPVLWIPFAVYEHSINRK